MRLSVVIPMFNRKHTIPDTLLSVVAQPAPFDYEVVVVDDGSTDGSVAVCREIASKYPQIRTVQQINSGPGAARNTGLSQAKGDYVWFVDSDDWISEDAFSKLDVLMGQGSDIIAFAAADAAPEGDRRRLSYKEMDGQTLSGIEFIRQRIRVNTLSYSFRFSVSIPCSVFKRDFLLEHQLQMLPEIYHEDFEWMPRVYFQAKRVTVSDVVLYRVRLTPGSIVRSVSPKKALDYLAVTRSLTTFLHTQSACRRQLCVAVGVAFCNALNEICRTGHPSDERFLTALRQDKYRFCHSLLQTLNVKLMALAVLLLTSPSGLPRIYDKLFRP